MKRRTFLSVAPVGVVAAASTAALITRETQHDTSMSADALPVLAGDSYLEGGEKRLVGAAFDRLIPPDDLSIGALEAGCLAFVDRQLAGDWGHATTRYSLGPNEAGTPEQGDQSPFTPRMRYRQGVAAMDARSTKDHGKLFADLPTSTQDAVLTAMEKGEHGADAQFFFNLLLQNVREGYFADPLYGGNKDMAGWKLVGFPGARYDYRAEIDRPGEDLKLAPINLMDRS